MKFTEDLATSRLNLITGFGTDHIIIQSKKIDSAHVISPNEIVSWGIDSFSEITVDHLAVICDLKPEVIILGTGEKHIIPEKSLLKALVETGIGFEVMKTPAACRTYNILVSEGRRAIVGLII